MLGLSRLLLCSKSLLALSRSSRTPCLRSGVSLPAPPLSVKQWRFSPGGRRTGEAVSRLLRASVPSASAGQRSSLRVSLVCAPLPQDLAPSTPWRHRSHSVNAQPPHLVARPCGTAQAVGSPPSCFCISRVPGATSRLYLPGHPAVPAVGKGLRSTGTSRTSSPGHLKIDDLESATRVGTLERDLLPEQGYV